MDKDKLYVDLKKAIEEFAIFKNQKDYEAFIKKIVNILEI